MTTIYLHAPKKMVDNEGKRSFEEILVVRIGDRYTMPLADTAKCTAVSDIVAMRKDAKPHRRARGKLMRLEATDDKTKSGVVRYDVRIGNLSEEQYVKPHFKFTRTGVYLE